MKSLAHLAKDLHQGMERNIMLLATQYALALQGRQNNKTLKQTIKLMSMQARMEQLKSRRITMSLQKEV